MALLAAIHRIITFAGDYGLCHPKKWTGQGGMFISDFHQFKNLRGIIP
jgi:hypothetical protein